MFEFSTNSEKDLVITRSQEMEEIWAEIIELTCEKINPQIIQDSSLKQQKEQAKYFFEQPQVQKKAF